jgi:hypothetical protein
MSPRRRGDISVELIRCLGRFLCAGADDFERGDEREVNSAATRPPDLSSRVWLNAAVANPDGSRGSVGKLRAGASDEANRI